MIDKNEHFHLQSTPLRQRLDRGQWVESNCPKRDVYITIPRLTGILPNLISIPKLKQMCDCWLSVWSPYICLRSCSKECFPSVNISFANISCEIKNICFHYNYVKTKAYLESVKKCVYNNVLAILTTDIETRLKIQKLKRLVGMPYILTNLSTMIAVSTIDS